MRSDPPDCVATESLRILGRFCTDAQNVVQTTTDTLSEVQEKHTEDVTAMLGNAQTGMKKALSDIEECISNGHSMLDTSANDVTGLFADITTNEKKGLQDVSDISAEHLKCFNENAKKSLQLVSELSESINDHVTNVKPDLPTGQTPAKRTIDLPKSGYLESLCTPAPEIVLEEFRRQKESRSTQTPIKEESAEPPVEEKENSAEECLSTPTKAEVSVAAEAAERSPLSAVTNSPSIGLCN